MGDNENLDMGDNEKLDMGDNENFIQEEENELREDLKEEVSGAFSMINFIFQFAGFFAGLLRKVVIEFAQIFNKN